MGYGVGAGGKNLDIMHFMTIDGQLNPANIIHNFKTCNLRHGQ